MQSKISNLMIFLFIISLLSGCTAVKSEPLIIIKLAQQYPNEKIITYTANFLQNEGFECEVYKNNGKESVSRFLTCNKETRDVWSFLRTSDVSVELYEASYFGFDSFDLLIRARRHQIGFVTKRFLPSFDRNLLINLCEGYDDFFQIECITPKKQQSKLKSALSK